jgi:hypothetical protein
MHSPNIPNSLRAQPVRAEPVLKAIRRKCLDCSAGQPAEVRLCPVTACPLWPFRMGKNPFSRRRGSPPPAKVAPLKKSPLIATVFTHSGPVLRGG